MFDPTDPPLLKALLATGDQSTEKCGFSASACSKSRRAAESAPRQRSVIPRWKNFSASFVPSRRAWSAWGSAAAHCPSRVSAHESASSPSIDGRSWNAL